MSELPDNWVSAPLETLGQWGSGGTPKRTNPAFYDGGTIPWLVIGDLNDSVVTQSATHITEMGLANSSAKLLPARTLLIAMYGSIGKLGITGFECATNQAIAFCKPDNEVTSLRYLFYALKNAKDGLIALGQGGAQQNISQGILKAYEVPLAPSNEQKRIVDKLDGVLLRVDACRDHLDHIPAILKRFRQSVLAAATSGKLTEDWRLRKKLKSNDHAAHDDGVILPEIPGTWTWGRGAELVDPSADIVYGIVQPGPKLNEGVPYVRGMDIENGQILVGQLLKTSKAIADRYSRSALKGGDVLLGIIRATKVAIVPDELNGANITQGTARFRPSSVIRTKYLAAVLESPVTQSWLHAHYRGIDMPGLNLADVRKVPIPLPPIEEQDEIVSRIEELFANAARIEACFITARTKVEKLTPALLAKAFRGELVPQDANDEPAAELLKRVRAMRLNVEAKQPGKTKKLVRRGK
ncbi:MAG: restriction endonuclease subunit S [Thiobacillus sp.]|nr:restriction endonuclease subunit S [Thiobacillus sp.]